MGIPLGIAGLHGLVLIKPDPVFLKINSKNLNILGNKVGWHHISAIYANPEI